MHQVGAARSIGLDHLVERIVDRIIIAAEAARHRVGAGRAVELVAAVAAIELVAGIADEQVGEAHCRWRRSAPEPSSVRFSTLAPSV